MKDTASIIQTENKVESQLKKGVVADLADGGSVELRDAAGWGATRTIRAEFIYSLCSSTLAESLEKIAVHGIRIRGARIIGHLDLSSLKIPFTIALKECFIPGAILRAITKIHGKNEDNLQDMQGLRQKFPLLSRK